MSTPRRLLLLPLLVGACLVAACAGRTGPQRSGTGLQLPPPGLGVVAPADGTLLSVLGIGVRRPYSSLGAELRTRFGAERWEAARRGLAGRADQVTYACRGERIGALVVRPEAVAGRRLPVVVLNRDGVGREGLDVDALLVELDGWARDGYVAVASAYRGNRLSQGTDDPRDVSDILALLPLVQRLGYADASRIYMLGRGEGARRTLAVLEAGAPVRAVALVGTARPVAGADAGDVPVLVVHGSRDAEVPLDAAEALARRLAAQGVEAELLALEDGDHDLAEHEAAVTRGAAAWFARHGGRSMLN